MDELVENSRESILIIDKGLNEIYVKIGRDAELCEIKGMMKIGKLDEKDDFPRIGFSGSFI